jgi:FKBP-type peptidyl-prolyl cis-trans isomerase FkpA
MMRPAFLLAALILVEPACNGRVAGGSAAPVDSDDDKTLYALGALMGRNVRSLNLTETELENVMAGLSDEALGNKPKVSIDQYATRIGQLRASRTNALADEQKRKGKQFADRAAEESGAQETPSGLVFKSLRDGEGESPKNNDAVQVSYRGTLVDGTEFDSSYKRKQPTELSLTSVIPCWTEGLQRMKPGGKARLVCPSSIAYGDTGRPPTIPGGATLVFEIELVSVTAKRVVIPVSAPLPVASTPSSK